MIRNIALPARAKMLVSFAGTSVINYGFGVVAAWLLVPGDFGLLAFVQTLLLIGGLVLNSGFVWSLTAQLVDNGGAQRAALVRGALVANLLLAGAIGAALLLLFAVGALRSGFETWPIAWLTAAALPFMAFVGISRAAAQGVERFGWVALIQVTEVACKAIAGVALILAGFGTTGAIAGFAVGGAVACLPGAWLLMVGLGVRPWGGFERPRLRLAGGMFGALIGMALLLNLDIVALKLFGGGDRTLVGHYQSAIILANMPYYLTTAMLPPLFIRAARLQLIEQTGPAVGEAIRLALLLAFPLELALFVAPDQAIGLLFASSYTPGAEVVRSLAVANCALILLAILSSAFQATGRARTPARILLAVAVCETTVLYLAVPSQRAIGAAVTFLAAALLALLVLGSVYLRAQTRALIRPAIGWLSRYTLVLALCLTVGMIVLAVSESVVLAAALAAPCYLGGIIGLRLIAFPSLASSSRHLRAAGGEK